MNWRWDQRIRVLEFDFLMRENIFMQIEKYIKGYQPVYLGIRGSTFELALGLRVYALLVLAKLKLNMGYFHKRSLDLPKNYKTVNEV